MKSRKVYLYLLIAICFLLIGCGNHWIRQLTDHMYCLCKCNKPHAKCECSPCPIKDKPGEEEPIVIYTVTFNLSGGSGTFSPMTGEAGTLITLPGAPAREGYTFSGWEDRVSGGAYPAGSTYTITASVTLYAVWEHIPGVVYHTVTYIVNGGSSVHGGEAAHNTAVNRPDDPTRAGHAFAGWYRDSALNNAYNFSAPVTGAITLYAKWTPYYTVSFSANGGGGAPEAQTALAGSSITLPAALTRTGYSFGGWNTNSAGTGDTYPAGSQYTVTGAITLYAKWAINSHAVTVTASPVSGGTVTGAGTYNYDAQVTITAAPDSGYTFIRWTVNSGGVTLSNAAATTATFSMPDSAVTITAVFAAGTGEDGDPFEITQDNVMEVLQNYIRTPEGLTKDYLLTDDIILVKPGEGESNWTPIGQNGSNTSQHNPFTGTFDGGGFTISWLTISATTSSHRRAMFSYIGETGVVKNLGLAGVDISGIGDNFGGLAGNNAGTVVNVYVTGNVSSNQRAGGIVGVNAATGIVENCYSTVDVTAYYTGGGITALNQGIVRNSYSTGTVSSTGPSSQASTGFGGIAGNNSTDNGATPALENNVALNPAIIRQEGTRTDFGRVVRNAAGTRTNNYALDAMQYFESPPPAGTGTTTFPSMAATTGGKDGADVSDTDAKTKSWWETAAADGGPGWVFADRADADEDSPWWWDTSAARPRLWFEE